MTADTRDASADSRDATADTRDASADTRDVTADTRDETADTRDETADTRDETADTRDETADTRDETADSRDLTANTRDATADTRDATANSRDATADTRDATADTRDATADTRDAEADTRDETAVRAHAADLQRSNDQLRRLDRLKSEFVAMASHELRTPLASITGFSSTMLDMWETIPDGDKHQYVEIIDAQSRRLARLVEDLLTISNIESGKIQTSPTTVNLAGAAEQAVRGLGAEGVTISCDRDATAFADADHVQQILVNFITNATKYGAAPVTIATGTVGDDVCIRITDCGGGVPIKFVPRLFERFSRSGGNRAFDGTGTGLGLSISEGLARAQGGSVRYEPNEPVGSCFIVQLPGVPAG